MDGVVTLNEVLYLVKVSERECFMFKVDFKEDYYSISLSFLDYMLWRIEFYGKWREWITTFIFSWSLSILVNGFPIEDISIQKGLKQGDPLALFFLLL